jgi:hypothetical protein
MAIAHPTMQQVAPHTWTFQAASVPVAPMKALCRACRQPVGILNPSGLQVHTGNYVVRGDCDICGGEVVLVVS